MHNEEVCSTLEDEVGWEAEIEKGWDHRPPAVDRATPVL